MAPKHDLAWHVRLTGALGVRVAGCPACDYAERLEAAGHQYLHVDGKWCFRDRDGNWGTMRWLNEFDVEWLTSPALTGPAPHLDPAEVPPVEWVDCARDHTRPQLAPRTVHPDRTDP